MEDDVQEVDTKSTIHTYVINVLYKACILLITITKPCDIIQTSEFMEDDILDRIEHN